jgi:hypothetical protein
MGLIGGSKSASHEPSTSALLNQSENEMALIIWQNNFDFGYEKRF